MTDKHTQTMNSSERLALTSEDVTDNLIKQLRDATPQIFSEGRVDFSKLQAALDEHIEEQPERYGLNWAGKRGAFRNVQIPSVATLRPQFEESVNWSSTENLIIEGDNLEVLKLLQKSYHSKVKMIYIDPPYNTGNEFIYPDNFREGLDDYLRYTGQLSADGTAASTNKDTSGRYHSNWLNMMYPRLFLARNLLKEDGVIFVSIDDHEVHNLRMLMDEVFGEENFLAQIMWQKMYSGKADATHFGRFHEYILCYARNTELAEIYLLPRTEEMNARYSNPDNDHRGDWLSNDLTAAGERSAGHYEIVSPTGKVFDSPQGKHWLYSNATMQELLQENRIFFGKNDDSFPRLKRFLTEVQQGRRVNTIWLHEEVGHTDEGTKELKKLFESNIDFQAPKPSRLMKQMLCTTTKPDDENIVLDFFAGSGTVAQAVLEANNEDGGNRKFILVQLPEKTDNTQYPTIAHITRERVRRVIAKFKDDKAGQLKLEDNTKQDHGFRAFKLDSSNFKIWRTDNKPQSAEQLAQQLNLYTNNVQAERSDQDRLFELILKSGLPLSASTQEISLTVRPEPVEGQVGHASTSSARTAIYSVADGSLLICLAPHLDRATLRALFARKPQTVLCLDTAFDGDDALKTNTVLEAQAHGIIFKTV